VGKAKKWWSKPRSEAFKAYAKRDAILKGLGFVSYKAYLKSDLWSSIRQQVLDRDGHQCRSCARKANQVHHRRYSIEVLRGEALEWLQAICGRCHRGIEFTSKGKVPLASANRTLKRRTRKAKKNCAWENSPEYRRLWREKKQILARPRAEVRELLQENRRQIKALINSQPLLASGMSRTDRRGESTATSVTPKDESGPGFVKSAFQGTLVLPVKVSTAKAVIDPDEVFTESPNTTTVQAVLCLETTG
jgi:hypothetical protein